ncbi:MAG TPA: hypothetical protein VJK53_02675 [Candidatus Paceibacterota bacterium]
MQMLLQAVILAVCPTAVMVVIAADVVTVVVVRDMSKKVVSILILGCVIAVVVAIVFFMAPGQKYSQDDTPTDVIMRSNADYASGKNYFSQRNYDLAKEQYQRALLNAQDDVQGSQIQFSIAVADEFAGRYLDAIKEFKAIAIDPSSYQFVRAYAVQEIGLIYYGYYGPSVDRDAIVAETFKDPPFAALKDGDDLNLAYRKLFEYASSIYPLGSSEGRIALWYADHITSDEVERNSSLMMSEIAIIKQSIEKADADIKRTINDPGAMPYIPGIYSLQGRALAKLASLGAASYTDAESRFEKAVAFADTIGRHASDRYRHAEFLATIYGEKRKGDIQQLLSIYRSTNTKLLTSTVDLFRAAQSSPELTEEKKGLVLLGQIDSEFKAYLISLGWHEADFK